MSDDKTKPGPHNNWGRNRSLAELLSDHPEEVTITGGQKKMLDAYHHVHFRMVSTHTPEISKRDIFWVVGYQRGKKTRNQTYSDTHTCKEVIILLNGAVVNYGRRTT